MVTRSWLKPTRDKDGLVKNTVKDIAIALQPVAHLNRFLVGEQSSILRTTSRIGASDWLMLAGIRIIVLTPLL